MGPRRSPQVPRAGDPNSLLEYRNGTEAIRRPPVHKSAHFAQQPSAVRSDAGAPSGGHLRSRFGAVIRAAAHATLAIGLKGVEALLVRYALEATLGHSVPYVPLFVCMCLVPLRITRR